VRPNNSHQHETSAEESFFVLIVDVILMRMSLINEFLEFLKEYKVVSLAIAFIMALRQHLW
jgi:hypothetical protein